MHGLATSNGMAKPKEARDVVNIKDKLETRKQYLELREKSARKFEDCQALFALSEHVKKPEEGGEALELNELFDMKHKELEDIAKELGAIVKNPAIPDRWIKSGNFNEELIEGELNKIRESLGESIPVKKPEVTIPLRPKERELIANNFPLGLYPRGEIVKYDGDDDWEVAGYDGYTGRGILKRQIGPGETEFIFAERIKLYLENRIKSKDLGKDGVVSLDTMTQEYGVNQQTCIEMSGDDAFDDERAEAEREARQGDKLGKKFKDLVKKGYKKVKENLRTLPQDIKDIIDEKREPFKATVKDIKKIIAQEYESAKITGKDLLEDLKTGKEKVGRWFEGHRQALTEAKTYMKLANEFRAVTEKVGTESFNVFFKDFENEKDLVKWAESGYDPYMLNDEQYYELYGYLYSELVKRDVELPSDITMKDRTELFDSVFHPGIGEVIKRNTQLQDTIVESVVTELSNALEHYQSNTTTLEDMEVRLIQFREELNKELTKIREGRVSVDKKKMIQFIRDALDKDYLSGYVYAPLKAFRSESKEKQSEVEEREVFEI